MENEFSNIKEGATVGQLYDKAIEIAREGDREKAKRYFDALVDHCVKTCAAERPNENIDKEKAEKIIHSNIGYWAGYHERGTIEKVHDVFGSAHPVFGKETPSPSDAFNMGVELGKSLENK